LDGLNEADIIRCLTAGYPRRADVRLGVGDDGAVLVPPAGRHLVSVLDTINEHVHFPAGIPASAVAHRALAVNLSDLAAMGAEPAWASLSLSLPSADPAWLADFAAGFRDLALAHRVALIGGDTVRGPLSVTVHLTGLIDADVFLSRSGARPGDLVVVSGTPGAAAAGLDLLDDVRPLSLPLRQAFLWPVPRVELGRALTGFATAAIDISDGLLIDLERLVESSRVGAAINLEQLPLAPAAVEIDSEEAAVAFALGGGDDYELCFTVPQSAATADKLTALVTRCACPLTVIGVIRDTAGVDLHRDGKTVIVPALKRWTHFNRDRTE
jgi:thiamine-monophosphate kinase